MPAKKNTSVVVAPAAQYQMAPPQQYQMAPQQQYQMAPPQQYQMAPPQQYSIPMPPMAPQVDPIDVLESQIKAMKEYVSAMEKTLKELKKSSKKRTVAPKDPSAPPKEMSAGVKAWNEYKKYVREDESAKARAANPALGDQYQIPPRLAMEIASQRKTAGDPKWLEYQTAPKAPKAPINVAPAPAPAPVPAPVPASATFQQYSFPMGQAAPSAAHALNPPAVYATVEEEEEELEEVDIDGKQYLFCPSTSGCWLMNPDGTQGAWAGKYDGASIDDSAEEE